MVLDAGSSMMHSPSDEDILEMDRLMSDGKRNYICNQPQLALDCFVILCEMLANFYGQESEKCVEAYLYYGKTLLDIARMENGVLGQAIKETADAEEETGSIENDQDVNGEGGSSNSNAEGSSAKPEKEEKDATVTEEVANGTSEITAEPDGSDCEVSDEDETDDISNMELAWEMFELTNVICKRQLTEEGHDYKVVMSTLADSKHGLAQISMETERYEESVNDFKECLKIYEEILEDKNDRLIAEAHYNIALALSFDKKYTEAIEQFEKAVGILKARVANLESKVKEMEEKGDKGKAPPELEGWKKEIKELNELIVLDMMTRIEDAHESKKLLEESIKTVKNAASEIFGSLGGSKGGSTSGGFKNGFDEGFSDGFDTPLAGDKEVINDCTAKIRSIKRKNVDDAEDTEQKKVKQTPLDEASVTTNHTSVAD